MVDHILPSGALLTYIGTDAVFPKLLRHKVLLAAKSGPREAELRKTKFIFGIHLPQTERSNWPHRRAG